MILYDETGKKIKINDNDETNIINKGCCGKVYHYNENQCVKVYYDSTPDKWRLKKEIYKVLKQISSDYLVDINMLLYKELEFDTIYAYIMKYYVPEKLDILTMNKEFFFDLLEKILFLFEQLTKEGIVVNDVKKANAIYTNKKIILIDPDMFYFSNAKSQELKITNYKILLQFIKNLCWCEAKDFITTNRCNPFYSINQLFDMEADENIIKNLSKNLKKYKYPIDYFKEKN